MLPPVRFINICDCCDYRFRYDCVSLNAVFNPIADGVKRHVNIKDGGNR